MAGAPKGNKNSSKSNRLWADTIRRALVQGDAQKLRNIAEKLVQLAEEGNMLAIREIGDRIDGKVLSVELSGPEGGEIKTVSRIELVPMKK